MHSHRTEMWTVAEGKGTLVPDGETRVIQKGDTAFTEHGAKHAVKADSELHFIEVQVGDELTEEDIERFDWDWLSDTAER